MRKIIVSLIVGLCILNANDSEDSVKLNEEYVKKTIEENFRKCLDSGKEFMDCDAERTEYKSKADIFQLNYETTERLIKDRELKKKLSETPYIKTQEEKDIDKAFDNCSKKAQTIQDHKACLKKIIIEKNTKD